jgi:hypothetical protein
MGHGSNARSWMDSWLVRARASRTTYPAARGKAKGGEATDPFSPTIGWAPMEQAQALHDHDSHGMYSIDRVVVVVTPTHQPPLLLETKPGRAPSSLMPILSARRQGAGGSAKPQPGDAVVGSLVATAPNQAKQTEARHAVPAEELECRARSRATPCAPARDRGRSFGCAACVTRVDGAGRAAARRADGKDQRVTACSSTACPPPATTRRPEPAHTPWRRGRTEH